MKFSSGEIYQKTANQVDLFAQPKTVDALNREVSHYVVTDRLRARKGERCELSDDIESTRGLAAGVVIEGKPRNL